MTIQLPDFLYYDDVKYRIKGTKGSGLFTAQDFGIEPDIFSTSCHRGYQAVYTIFDQQLVLAEITMLVAESHQMIDGVQPVPTHKGSLYQGLNLHCPFTGGLMLSEEYGHPYLLELHLVDGILQDMIQHPRERIFGVLTLDRRNETIPQEFQPLIGYQFADYLF